MKKTLLALSSALLLAAAGSASAQTYYYDYGYGQVCDLQGRPIDGLTMCAANQEHGILALRGDVQDRADIVARLPVGTLLRVLPNHACATAAQFPGYHVLQPSGGLLEWERFGGW